MNRFTINADETSTEFISYVAKRVELARDPINQISLVELKIRVDKKIQDLRKNEG